MGCAGDFADTVDTGNSLFDFAGDQLVDVIGAGTRILGGDGDRSEANFWIELQSHASIGERSHQERANHQHEDEDRTSYCDFR